MNSPETPDVSQQESTSSSRRRFLGTGIGPVILTLASQPALAATCFTPSRSLSRNMSLSQEGKYGECNGVSPGNYAAQSDPNNQHGNSYNWPILPSTPFHPTFMSGPYGTYEVPLDPDPGTRSMTMLEVLNLSWAQQGDKYNVAMHMVGAYLNILNGLIPPSVLTTGSLMTIWNAYATAGKYNVTGSVWWYGPEIVTYLKSNGISP